MNEHKIIPKMKSNIELKNGCKHSSSTTVSRVSNKDKMLVPTSFPSIPTYYKRDGENKVSEASFETSFGKTNTHR